MVVRSQEDIHPAAGHIFLETIGSREAGIAGIWLSREGEFHVGYGEVGFLDQSFHCLEIGLE